MFITPSAEAGRTDPTGTLLVRARVALAALASLGAGACGGPTSPVDLGPDNNALPELPASAASPAPPELPYLAVNTTKAVLPLGRTLGQLAIRDRCVIFSVGEQVYTPIWPTGTRLSDDGRSVIIPRGRIFALGQGASLDGAAFSLENRTLQLAAPVPARCPNATYAINM